MMGRAHALTGAAAGAAYAAHEHLSIPAGLLAMVLCAGSALLPDIDHERATVSQTFGALSRWIARRIPHRRGTHSIPGILLLGAITAGAERGIFALASVPILALIMMLVFSGAVRIIRIRGWIDDALAIAAGVACAWFAPLPVSAGVCVVIGALVHVAGDVITKQGIPIFWPFAEARFSLRLIKAGGFTELWIITPLTIGCIGWSVVVWLIN